MGEIIDATKYSNLFFQCLNQTTERKSFSFKIFSIEIYVKTVCINLIPVK